MGVKFSKIAIGEVLKDQKHIDLILENGVKYTCDIPNELAVPDTAEQLWQASRRGPGKIAFWERQAARVMLEFKRHREAIKVIEAKRRLHFRQHLAENPEPGMDPDKYGVLDNLVQASPDVIEATDKLLYLEYLATVLAGIRNGVEHRLYIIRKRLNRSEQEAKD